MVNLSDNLDKILDNFRSYFQGDIEREEQENTVEDEWEEIRRRKEAEADSEMRSERKTFLPASVYKTFW